MAARRLGGAAALALAALAGCGNYSTEDIAFIEALPGVDALHVAVPGQAGATAAGGQVFAACGPLGPATTFTDALATGNGMNAGLDWILGIVDFIRTLPPTERHRDLRIWGPYPDSSHPAFESRAVVSRSYHPSGLPVYAFSLETRRRALEVGWHVLISGNFIGASGRTGHGDVTLHFTVIRALGLNAKPDDPTVDVTIGYDRRSDPRLVSLSIPPGTAGFGLPDFDYAFESYRDGRAHFDFAVVDAQGNRFVVNAGFIAAGAGKGDVTLFPISQPGNSYSFTTCWDAAGCVVAVNDPLNIAGYCASAPCQINWPAGCPAVP